MIYPLLFHTAADTRTTFARDSRHLGSDLGGTAIVHTLGHNPSQHLLPATPLATRCRFLSAPTPHALKPPPTKALNYLSPRETHENCRAKMNDITLEPTGSSDFERCECCSQNSRTVWGLARRNGAAHAAYFVHWTRGKVADDGAHFDLILGRWGDSATKADRYAVSLPYLRGEQGSAFMVIDAIERPIAHNELVGRALRRNEVIGTTLATDAFELVDAIWLKDRRITEVTGDGA